METTLTKRPLAGATVKASAIFQSNKNLYKITTQIEKTAHNLLIGGIVDINITGLNVYSNLYDQEIINDYFNQEKSFYVVDENILINESYIKSKLYNNNNSLTETLTVISGTPTVKINNDKITLLEGNYNFELLNKELYPSFRVWDTDYKFKIQEIGIGNKGFYDGAPDYYSDSTLNLFSDLNEQNLSFKFCQYVEISIVDGDNNNISSNDYTKISNIGLIINKL